MGKDVIVPVERADLPKNVSGVAAGAGRPARWRERRRPVGALAIARASAARAYRLPLGAGRSACVPMFLTRVRL
jgi:hypothetical protein